MAYRMTHEHRDELLQELERGLMVAIATEHGDRVEIDRTAAHQIAQAIERYIDERLDALAA